MTVDFKGVLKKVHKRIKILTSKGLDSGNITLNFQAKDDYEDIKYLKAQIFYPSDNYSKSVELKEGDFYLKDIDKNWKMYEFTFPKL